MTRTEAKRLRELIVSMGRDLSDVVILDYPALCPYWQNYAEYKTGDRVRYNDKLYKCLQDHTAQETWDPADAPSLWAKVINEDAGCDIPEWEQPDSTNAYMKGDRVRFNCKTYECLMNNCVWSPADYPAAWKEVDA